MVKNNDDVTLESIPPEYWLKVCKGLEAAITFAMSTTPEQLKENAEIYPIYFLPEFPSAMMALNTLPDIAIDANLVEKCLIRAKDIERSHTILRQHETAYYAARLWSCANTLLAETQGIRFVNLKKTIELCQTARSISSSDPIIAFCLNDEADAHLKLADFGVDAQNNLELAAKLFKEAGSILSSMDETVLFGKCAYNEGCAIYRLAELGIDVLANFKKASRLFRQTRGMFDSNEPLFGHCLIMEGNVLQNLPSQGEKRIANLNKAIRLHRKALRVFASGSTEYATCLGTMGTSYLLLAELSEDMVNNLNKSLNCTQKALSDLPKEHRDYANCLMQEGNVYRNFAALGKNQRVNLKQAIQRYESALSHPSFQGLERANCMFNEGHAYLALAEMGLQWTRARTFADLIKHDRECLEKAIELSVDAHNIVPKNSFPFARALMNEALARVYLAQRRIDIQYNLETAASLYSQAQCILPPYSQDCGVCLQNEGLTRLELSDNKIDAQNNLEIATQKYFKARSCFAPQGGLYAICLQNEGVARQKLANLGVNTTENLVKAAQLFQSARDIFRKTGNHPAMFRACKQLGEIVLNKGDWLCARDIYHEAIESLEQIRSSTFLIRDRHRWMSLSSGVFQGVIEACLRLGHYEEALEYAERSYARALVDMLYIQDMEPRNVPPHISNAYKALRAQYEELDTMIALGDPGMAHGISAIDREKLASFVVNDQLQLLPRLVALEEELRRYDPDFFVVAKPLALDGMRKLASRLVRTLILIWVGESRGIAFCIQPNGKFEWLYLPSLTEAQVQEWVVGDLNGTPLNGWMTTYKYYKDGEINRHEWMAQIEQTLAKAYNGFIQPLHQWLTERNQTRAAVIVSGTLGLLPLHAAACESDHRYLIEDLEIIYAPSAQILDRCVQRYRHGYASVLCVGNPDETLVYSEWEVEQIATLLESREGSGVSTCLLREKATAQGILEGLTDHSVAHLSCHAWWNPVEPLESGLIVAGERDLMLAQLLGQRRLDNMNLIVLSACDSSVGHLAGLRGVEYLGLPSGFLIAGAKTVIGSLWAVPDLPTALLMTRMYENLLEGLDAASALRLAQLWLKDLVREETVKKVNNILQSVSTRLSDRQRAATQKWLTELEEQPFVRPYFWAGFIVIGAPVRVFEKEDKINE